MSEKYLENEIIDYYTNLGYSMNQIKEIIDYAKQNYDIALKVEVTNNFKSWCYLLCRSFNLVPNKSE